MSNISSSVVHSFNGLWHLIITSILKNVEALGSCARLSSRAPYRGSSACLPQNTSLWVFIFLKIFILLSMPFVLLTCAVNGETVC